MIYKFRVCLMRITYPTKLKAGNFEAVVYPCQAQEYYDLDIMILV